MFRGSAVRRPLTTLSLHETQTCNSFFSLPLLQAHMYFWPGPAFRRKSCLSRRLSGVLGSPVFADRKRGDAGIAACNCLQLDCNWQQKQQAKYYKV